MGLSQGWEFAHRISEQIARFLPKKWATWAICSRSLILSERFAHFAQKEWVKLLLFLNYQKTVTNVQKIRFFLANRSVFVSERENEWFAKKPERFAYSLICHERPEWIVHICSFVMSDLSDFYHSCSFVLSNLRESLTFAHLSWAMSKWANSQPWALLLVELFSSCQLKGEMGLSYWWISSVVVRQRGEMGLSYIGESVQ